MLPESLLMFFLNAKKLNPKLGSAVFFDSRIIHRGTPIAKKNLDYVKSLFQNIYGAIASMFRKSR